MTGRWATVRTHLGRLGLAALCVVVLAGPAIAWQQPPDDGFVAVSPDELAAEALPAAPFIYAAYATAWVVLIGYVFALWRKLGRLEQDLRDVHRELGADR